MKKLLIVLSTVVIISSMFLSCQKDLETKETIQPIGNDFSVSLEDAKVICQKGSNSSKSRIAGGSVISSAKTKKDKSGNDVYHVITYTDNKGYKVVSADKRSFPLLVESDNGQFDTTVVAISIWMHDLESYIEKQKIKKMNKGEEKYLSSVWKDFTESGDPTKEIKIKGKTTTNRLLPGDGDGGGGSACQDQYWQNENFLNTTWAQWGGYNQFFAPDPCGVVNGYCGRVPAGCGPVAIAQIMRRHQRPNGFNYGIMPPAVNNPFNCNFNANENEMANLLKYASDRAGSTPITTRLPWSCSTSTSTFPWAIPSAFSDAGYSSGGTSQDYVLSNIVNDLFTGFPVIVSGTKGWVLNFSEWHIWVADGVRYWVLSQDCISGGQVHFNMGWGGNGNAWYFSPYNMGYDTQVKSITNIRP
jgi:hypothetical protein